MSAFQRPASGETPHVRYERLISGARGVPPISTAVVDPCDEASLGGVVAAAEAGIIAPILIGPAREIRAAAERRGFDVKGFQFIDAPRGREAVARAVEIVREGRAGLLANGNARADAFLAEVGDRGRGIGTARRLSHVFIMDVPGHPDPLFVTDALINVDPDLATKADIVRNAIELHVSLGLGTPRVAILSASDLVVPGIPGTIDAACLCKMSDRGQIVGGILDGPLALDDALDPEAVVGGFRSEVAGRAEILVAPNRDAGSMLIGIPRLLAGADGAGVVLGAVVPIVLFDQADNARTRLASFAAAALHARRRSS